MEGIIISIEFDSPNKEYLQQIFRIKTALLCQGLIVSAELLSKLEDEGRPLNMGRKGGAGPAGGRYFEFENGASVNVPLYHESYMGTPYVLSDLDSENKAYIIDQRSGESVIPLRLLPAPEFYTDLNSQGIEYRKIALIHGKDTLATTIEQQCKYWRCGEQCKFCAIEVSLEQGATTEIKTGEEIVEAITAAKQENPKFADNITLTMGTVDEPNKGIQRYIDVIQTIKATYLDVHIHIQIEPVEDLSVLDLGT